MKKTKTGATEKSTAELERFLSENERICVQLAQEYRSFDPAIGSDDLAQEARISFWIAHETYNPQKNAKELTYATAITRKTILGGFRKGSHQKRRLNHIAESFDVLRDEMYATPVLGKDMFLGPEDTLAGKELWAFVDKILREECSKREMIIFYEIMQQGTTQCALAHTLGCSQSTVSMDYGKVRKKLALRLREQGYME